MNTIGVLFTVAVFFTVHTFIVKMFKSANKLEVKKKYKRPAVVNTKLIR